MYIILVCVCVCVCDFLWCSLAVNNVICSVTVYGIGYVCSIGCCRHSKPILLICNIFIY